MASPIKATYDDSGNLTGFAELQSTDTFDVSKVSTFVGLKETATALDANSINLNLGTVFSKTISADTTFTVSNPAASGLASSFILELTNGGAHTINWWTGIKWASGTVPTLTSASGVDILGFFTRDGGTTWRGFMLAKDSK